MDKEFKHKLEQLNIKHRRQNRIDSILMMIIFPSAIIGYVWLIWLFHNVTNQ